MQHRRQGTPRNGHYRISPLKQLPDGRGGITGGGTFPGSGGSYRTAESSSSPSRSCSPRSFMDGGSCIATAKVSPNLTYRSGARGDERGTTTKSTTRAEVPDAANEQFR